MRCHMRTRLWILLFILAAAIGSRAGNQNTYPLAEERGTAGILAALEKLPVYVHVLQTTAHPDDESAGTLTWLARKFHARTALFCLTRGEGGQNILGNEKYEELGLVRSGELLQACRYYGVDLYFGTAVDFGFSKTAEETLAKWGHEETLEGMVRFIRQYRPDIILSRFQGNAADGHGHHQAAGIVTREAFGAAADPTRFPQQIKEGLQPWKSKKLYVSSMSADMAPATEGSQDGVVRIPVGDYSPALGLSYREIASEGYSKHRTQGNGATASQPGRSYEYFRLTAAAQGTRSAGNSFFDAIDTSLNAIYELAGDEKNKASFLKEDLQAIQQCAVEALQSFRYAHPEGSAPAAARGVQHIDRLIKKVDSSALSDSTRTILLDALHEKLRDFQNAVHATLGILLIARTQDLAAVPGEKEPFNLYFYNQGSESVSISGVRAVSTRDKGKVSFAVDSPSSKQIPGGGSLVMAGIFELSPAAGVTEPFWSLENNSEARYRILRKQDEFAPFGPSELKTEVRYLFQGNEIAIDAEGMAQAGDPIRGSDFQDFQIVPALSIALNPKVVIAPISGSQDVHEFQASVLNNQGSGVRGTLALAAPAGWKVEPLERDFELSRKGETYTTTFKVRSPAGIKTGNHSIEAVARVGTQEYRRGYHTISYPENWTRNFYIPAQSKIDRFDIRIAPGLMVGYIPGAGDDVPNALEQLGIKVQTLSASDLAYGDLRRFAAIVTGIRAYNVNEDLRANNRRLLNYVAEGGTLVVQYVRPMERPARGSQGSPFLYGPYPMSVSESDRITVEDSPIKILDTANPVFSGPNKITDADFRDWVQERGLYFMNSWDSHYTPLLSGNDPGEEPKKGGMLYAKYGNGHYIYSAYSWFRQLPAGVPGAFRIFANMLSLGKSTANSK